MEYGRVIKPDVHCHLLDDLNEPLYQIYPALAKRKGVILNYFFHCLHYIHTDYVGAANTIKKTGRNSRNHH